MRIRKLAILGMVVSPLVVYAANQKSDASWYSGPSENSQKEPSKKQRPSKHYPEPEFNTEAISRASD